MSNSASVLSLCVILGSMLSACSTSVSGGITSGCSSPGNFCYEHPAVCGVAGAIVVGGAIAIITNNGHSRQRGAVERPPVE